MKILMLAEMYDDRHLLTVAEAAGRLGVNPRTVLRWLSQKRIKGEKTVLVPFPRRQDMFRLEWRIDEEDLVRPMRKPTEAGVLGAAVLAFMHLVKTPTVELAYKSQLAVNTILRMKQGKMPRPVTLRRVYEAYPEAIDKFVEIIVAAAGPSATYTQVRAQKWEAILAAVRAQAPEYFTEEVSDEA